MESLMRCVHITLFINDLSKFNYPDAIGTFMEVHARGLDDDVPPPARTITAMGQKVLLSMCYVHHLIPREFKISDQTFVVFSAALPAHDAYRESSPPGGSFYRILEVRLNLKDFGNQLDQLLRHYEIGIKVSWCLVLRKGRWVCPRPLNK
jgi:hypothetical protein